MVSPRSVARIMYPSPAVPVSQSFLSSPDSGRVRICPSETSGRVKKGGISRVRKAKSTKRVHGN